VRRRDNSDSTPLAAGTAERLAAIVEAAERAAVGVIDDAEKQARQHLEQAQIEADALVASRLASLSELTDSLIAQAEEIRSQAERLAFSLQEAKRGLGAGGEERPPEAVRPTHLSAVDPVAEPALAEATELRVAETEGGAAGARLLATQMAVSGSSREEIEARLRNGFEIEDTASILDAILGPEE
jgi:vacuolar-type H+-ATPase subunit H